MDSKAILNVSIKVVGIFYALSAFSVLMTDIAQTIVSWDLFTHTSQGDLVSKMMEVKITYATIAATRIILFVIALILIFNSEKITTRILKENSSAAISTNITHISILDLSIKIIGVFALLSAIPYISVVASKYWIMKDKLTLLDPNGKIQLTASVLSLVLYFCVGCVFIVYSDAIASKLSREGYEEANVTDEGET